MAYCSVPSILLIVPGLPQTTTATGYSACSVVVARHITRADALIDSKIAKRYSTPISPTPPLLGSISEDLATYYSYKSFYTQDNYNKLESYETLKDSAIALLDEIRKGEIDIVDSSGALIAENESGSVSILDSNNVDYHPFFGVDEPTDWKFDDDQLDEIEDDRS